MVGVVGFDGFAQAWICFQEFPREFSHLLIAEGAGIRRPTLQVGLNARLQITVGQSHLFAVAVRLWALYDLDSSCCASHDLFLALDLSEIVHKNLKFPLFFLLSRGCQRTKWANIFKIVALN